MADQADADAQRDQINHVESESPEQHKERMTQPREMCAAVPPKLIHPSLDQKRKASLKEGCCTAAESFIVQLPGTESETYT